MNADDETLISALLDGEVEPDLRSRVESALFADARLADEWRELSAVRDLLGSLGRPALPADLSASVVARIGARRHGTWRFVAFASGTRAGRVATLTAAAAALFICARVGVDRLGRDHARRPAVATAPNISAPRPGPSPVKVAVTPEPSPLRTPGPREEQPALPRVGTRNDPTTTAHAWLRGREFDATFTVTLDPPEGRVGDRVGDLLRETPRGLARSDFLRFDRPDGEGFEPGEVVAFAVVMTETEAADFQKRLTERLGAAGSLNVTVSSPRPGLAASLARKETSLLVHGTPVADLRPPRTLRPEESASALLQDDRVRHKVILGPVRVADGAADPLRDPSNRPDGHETDVVVVRRDGPTAEQNHSGPHPSNRLHQADPGPASAVARSPAPASPSPGRLILVRVKSLSGGQRPAP